MLCQASGVHTGQDIAHVIGHAGPCSHADLVPQVVGGAEGQHWLPPSTSEGLPGIMNASVAKVVD